MPYILHSLLSCLLMAAPAIVFSSNFEINGNNYVPCIPSDETYSVSGEPVLAGSGANGLVWKWQVRGGEFAGGKKEIYRKDLPGTVDVRWYVEGSGRGLLTLTSTNASGSSKEGGYSASKLVTLGPPEPTEILMGEDGILCSGNWFTVATSVPLNGSETVEWTVVNGLDVDGNEAGTVQTKGEGASRIFLKRSDPGRPLEISVKISSDCGAKSVGTATKKEVFREEAVRLIGPASVRAGEEATYYMCRLCSGNSCRWSSSGGLVSRTETSIIVNFPEEGQETVQLTVTGCGGEETTISRAIKVMPPSSTGTRAPRGALVPAPLSYKVYPNPSHNGTLKVEMLQTTQEGKVEVISLQGQPLRVESIIGNTATIETGGMPPGIYLLRIKTPTAEAVSRIGINMY